MSEALLQAYTGTRYVVLGAGGDALAEAMVGASSPGVDALLRGLDATTGVFVTAHNPRSEPTASDVNDAAHDRMAAALAADGVTALPHVGIGEDPAWRPELGFFAVDLAEPDAVALAEAYGQNAVVVVELGRPTRLVLTSVMGT